MASSEHRFLMCYGSSYVSGDLADWLRDQGMGHVRGAPNHPQTQGKIERWHQTLKNRILLEIYYLPGALEQAVAAFVEHYNHRRYHESLGNLTPARGNRLGTHTPELIRGTNEIYAPLHVEASHARPELRIARAAAARRLFA